MLTGKTELSENDHHAIQCPWRLRWPGFVQQGTSCVFGCFSLDGELLENGVKKMTERESTEATEITSTPRSQS